MWLKTVSVLRPGRERAAPARSETDERITEYHRRAAYAHGPGDVGLDPTRYGDWEYNGRCTDFE